MVASACASRLGHPAVRVGVDGVFDLDAQIRQGWEACQDPDSDCGTLSKETLIYGFSSVETTGELSKGVIEGARGTASSNTELLITVTPAVDSYVTYSGALTIITGGSGEGTAIIDFGGAGFDSKLINTAGSIARQTHLVHAGSQLTLAINAESFGFQQEKAGVTTISNSGPVTFSGSSWKRVGES